MSPLSSMAVALFSTKPAGRKLAYKVLRSCSPLAALQIAACSTLPTRVWPTTWLSSLMSWLMPAPKVAVASTGV